MKSLVRIRRRVPAPRRGVVIVLTGLLLVVIFAFVSLSIDSGRIVLTETQMQNAVDAASLAASQEITAAVYAAGQGLGPANIDANSDTIARARQMAADVAIANGVHVDANTDVFFGRRGYDFQTDSWVTDWNQAPFNVVKVVARRTDANLSAPTGELPLAFGWAVGRQSVPLETTATSFVEARDMVLVLDFSGSMSDDTEVGAFGRLGQSNVEASLDVMWQELRDSDARWPDKPSLQKWLPAFGLINSPVGTYINSSDTNYIYNQLKLGEKYSNGTLKYPYPQSGRYSDGTPKNYPTDSQSESRWKSYINYAKSNGGAYKRKFGFRSLMNYIQQNNQMTWTESEDLWRTSHYPFTAVKNGASLFLNFLDELGYGDEIGVVSYGSYAVWEDTHRDGEVDLDVSSDPISDDYATIDDIQRRHQAGHYDVYTNIGDGMLKARELLVGKESDSNDTGHSRYGARPTIILMTDGNANRRPNNWSLPGSFQWKDWTDFDGNGTADYSSSDKNVQYAFWEVTQAAERGITVHTMAVGASADTDFMRAAAFAGNGLFISVPGGSTIAELEEQMLEAFGRIASKVPPAQLVYEFDAN